MHSISPRQILLLGLLLTACQQPQTTVSAPSPCPTSTPSSPVPTPPPYIRSGPLPDIQSLTDADVVSRQELLRAYYARLSPAASQLSYLIERERRVRLKQEVGASQKTFELWVHNRSTSQQTRLAFNGQLFYNHMHWLNEQNLLLTEAVGLTSQALQRPQRLQRLTRYDLTSGSQRVLLDSVLSLSKNSIRNDWVYFMREAGKVEAMQLDSGESKQWPLQGTLAGRTVQIETLPDGRLLLSEDRSSPGPADSGLCVGPPCTPRPLEIYVYIFDPATGQATAIPSFQGGDYITGSLQASADGRYLAWAHASGFALVELATLTQKLQLNDAELLAWLSNEQVLLRYPERLEVYDITSNRALGQIPLGADDQTVGYDTATQQVLLKARGSCGSGTQPVLKAWDLSKPAQPGLLRTLPDSAQIHHALGPTASSSEQPQLLASDMQARQGPPSFFRLRPQGQGLEKLLELPYNPNPNFSFAPAQAKESERWSLTLYPIP